MDYYLILGTLLLMVGGLIGTLTDTRTEDKKGLTKSGWLALSMTIVGTIVSLISQQKANEDTTQQMGSIINNTTNALSILNTQGNVQLAEVSTANKSLDVVQDIVTRFNTLAVNCQFELPQSDARVAVLVRELHHLASKDTSSQQPSLSQMGLNIYRQETTNATIILQPPDWNHIGFQSILPSLDTLSNVWQALPLTTGRIWINRTNLSPDDLEQAKQNADISLFNANFGNGNPGGLIYFESNQKVYLVPTRFDCDANNKDCWFSDNRIVGIHHLAGSEMVVEFNWCRSPQSPIIDPILSQLRPDFIHVGLDHNSVFMHDIETQISEPEGPYAVKFVLSAFCTCHFPTEDEMVGGGAAKPPAYLNNCVIIQ